MWRRRLLLYLYSLLWNKTSEFHKKYERLNAENLSQLTQKPADISEPIFTILTSF